MSSHFASAAGSEMRTFRKSAGRVWTGPAEIALLVIFLTVFLILGSHSTSLRDSQINEASPCPPSLETSYGAPKNKKPPEAALHFSCANCVAGCAARGDMCTRELTRSQEKSRKDRRMTLVIAGRIGMAY